MYIVPNPAAVLRGSAYFLIVSLLAGVTALTMPGDALAQPQAPVDLGAAAPFGVLGASTVTNTGTTTIDGDLGLSPGSSVTGFPPGVVTGTIFINTSEANDGQADLTTAYNDAAGRPSPAAVSGDLGGQVLVPGLYNSSTSLEITSGDLTLDGQGDPNAVWIFQMGSTLTVMSDRKVILTGDAQGANVFWQVGSSATIGTNAVFNGTIMADQSIALQTGATLCGRALARIGAVTLDANTVTLNQNPVCLTPLPIEMSSFSATADGFDVVLRWETMSERNNSGFEVQYQPDTAWKALAFVAGAGNSTARRSYEYRVTELVSGTHQFRLKQIDFDSRFEYSSVVEVTVAVPLGFTLKEAYPNPFNPVTTMGYVLPRESEVRLSVFDVFGREVRVVVTGVQPAGSHEVVFDASELPTGAYFYRLQAGNFEDVKGLVVLR